MRASFLVGLLAISCVGVSNKTVSPSPAKKEWLFLLPVKIKPEVTDAEAARLPLIARGAIISAFDERNMPVVSPVQMQVTEREMNIKLAEDGAWTKELFKKLSARWKARYVATITVLQLESKEGPIDGVPPTPPPPGAQLTTSIKLVGSMFDSQTGKYVFENREHALSVKVGRPGPSDEQVQSERMRAVIEASKGLFKDFLKKLPLKPPARGIGAGGG